MSMNENGIETPSHDPATIPQPIPSTPGLDFTAESADPSAVLTEPAVPTKPKGPRFDSLGLGPDVLRALADMGFTEAMEVQAATVPLARSGRDIMVQSRTGSGKTAAFGIPFVNDIVDPAIKAVQAIVLLPTRELALQVAAELARIAAHRPITVAPIYGGAPMGRQVEMLRAGAQIVCGTPGRVLDHLRRGTLNLDRVRCAVLDECDEMLSMGFQEDIEHILEHTPQTRQTLLFSATVPEGIQRLSRRFMKTPEFLKLSADHIGVNEIRHVYYSIPGVNREQELLRILKFEDPRTAIVFCNTREETSRVAEFLRKQGFEAEAISSDLAQNDRERVMTRMRAGEIQFLVATDVAARGIDIEALSHVFNYTFPEAPEIYIHRTGRTGRAGKHGTAISLIGPTEVGSFYYLKLLYKILPEERALPSEAEIRSHREGERVLQLRQALTGEPGVSWRELARRLMGALDGERLVASLLAQSFASLPAMPAAPPPAPAPTIPPAAAPTGSRATPSTSAVDARSDRRPEPQARDSGLRSDRGDRGRDRGRERDRPIRSDRADRPDRDRRPPVRGRAPERERERAPERMTGQGPSTPSATTEKEFWEVWSEEKAAERGSAPGALPGTSSATTFSTNSATTSAPQGAPASIPARREAPSRSPEIPEGMARLYLNLGRKDGASENEVRDLLRQHTSTANAESAAIDVMNTHTYLNVATADADGICAALTGKQLGPRDLVCERARPRR